MKISPRDRRALRSLKRGDIEKTLASLKRFTRTSNWVGKSNRYVVDTKKKIAAERKTGIVEPRHLSQYIAASGSLHCVDGWSYLGRAITSLLRGDPHRARHLAYYAELRAAMSLLATTGIGVFDKYHFVVDAPNSVATLSKVSPTHQFVWDCLEFWCKQPWSGDLFASIVRPNGRSLDDWLSPLGGSKAVAPKAREWFLQWGVDLKLPAKDREARNVSSYRPDGIPNAWSLDSSTTFEFARDIWLALEPSNPSRFEMIDSQILRLAIESIFKAQNGISPADEPVKFARLVNSIVENQGLPQDGAKQWAEFFLRRRTPGNLGILEFSKVSPKVRENSHYAIVARATLLLRLASGSSADLFQSAGFGSNDIAFWWQRVGESRGLWEGPKSADDILDLWADIELAIGEFDNFQKRHTPEAQTFFRVGNELGQAVVSLGSCERVAMWSVIPG